MKSERSKLIKKLDKVFSLYIRQRDKGICFTCGKQQDWKLTDCGHYIRRGKMSHRWSESNCNCQCKRCNSWLEGEKVIYRQNLVKKYGEQFVDMMERQSNETCKIGISDINVLIDYYTKEIEKNDNCSIIQTKEF